MLINKDEIAQMVMSEVHCPSDTQFSGANVLESRQPRLLRAWDGLSQCGAPGQTHRPISMRAI